MVPRDHRYVLHRVIAFKLFTTLSIFNRFDGGPQIAFARMVPLKREDAPTVLCDQPRCIARRVRSSSPYIRSKQGSVSPLVRGSIAMYVTAAYREHMLSLNSTLYNGVFYRRS